MNAFLLRGVGVLTQATPSPVPTPGLREGLDEGSISPGLAGFLAVFGIALASLVLFYSLTGKLRRVRRRGEAEDGALDAAIADDDGASGGVTQSKGASSASAAADDGASSARAAADDGASGEGTAQDESPPGEPGRP